MQTLYIIVALAAALWACLHVAIARDLKDDEGILPLVSFGFTLNASCAVLLAAVAFDLV